MYMGRPGKGTIQRKADVSEDEIARNWARIFGSAEGTIRAEKEGRRFAEDDEET